MRAASLPPDDTVQLIEQVASTLTERQHIDEMRRIIEIDLSCAEWRKSIYSGQSGNCVDVASNLPGPVALRDSKEPDGVKLVVSREAW